MNRYSIENVNDHTADIYFDGVFLVRTDTPFLEITRHATSHLVSIVESEIEKTADEILPERKKCFDKPRAISQPLPSW